MGIARTRRRKPAAVLALLLWTTAGVSRAAPFLPADIWALQMAEDPNIRPDGTDVAYSRVAYDSRTDREKRTLWLVNRATGREAPLLDADIAASSPRWSPDGARLAFVASDHDGTSQLFVRWSATAKSAMVARLPSAPAAISWAPDGLTIAVTLFVPSPEARLGSVVADVPGATLAPPLRVVDRFAFERDGEGVVAPGRTQLFLIDVGTGRRTQLTSGDKDIVGRVAWTRDSKALIYAARRPTLDPRAENDSNLFRISAGGGTPTALTTRLGPDEAPAISPDGTKIAFIGYDDAMRMAHDWGIYILDVRAGLVTRVPETLHRSLGAPLWAPDGRSLITSYADHGVAKIARLGLDGKVEVLTETVGGADFDRPYTSGRDFSMSRDGTIAYLMGDPTRPSDVAILVGRRTLALTALNADLTRRSSLAQTSHFPVTSTKDGLPIDAWLVTPPGFDPARRYPTILEIHGGPVGSYGPVWSTVFQLYAAAGYVVVYANPRGSSSYGEAFANRIQAAYPGADYDDLMSVVDGAIARGVADPDRLFVTGGSGGGLLTAWIVGKTSRFRAAVSQKPVINWTSEVLANDGGLSMIYRWLGREPWVDPDFYWAHSPLSLVGTVSTPTMLLVGTDDLRTPPAEARQYFRALLLRHVPTMLVEVPGASHESLVQRPSQLAAVTSATLAWFARYDVPAGTVGSLPTPAQ